MIKTLEFDAVLFLLVGAIVGMFLVSYVKNQPVQFQSNAFSFSQNTTTQPTNTPTPTIAFEPTTITDSQISSDGTHKVILKTTTNQDQSKTYNISTSDPGPVIFTKTLDPNENISLPFNSWEPLNRYFFIQENLSEGPKILVFTADGAPFGDGQPYLDLTDAYFKLGSSYNYDAATGWAGYDLIVINTKATDGTQGASYWFEPPYGSIIPLSTKF
jgi:hypothetical protein